MRIDRNEKQKTDTNSGVSEIIGAILLISVVALAVAIIGVFFFSQPTPTKIPNLNFMTGVNGSTLYLYHNGGDALNVGEFSVLLDGVPHSYSVSDRSSQWSLGKNLIVPILSMPQNVQIVYNSSSAGGAVLLDQAAADIVSTVNVTADQQPYLDCSAVQNPLCAGQISQDTINTLYLTNTKEQLIRFKKSNQARGVIPGAAGAAYHFNFTVSADNSSIVIGASGSDTCAAALKKFDLNNGDTVGIVLIGSPDSFYIYGIGSEIWYMNIGNRNRVAIQITNKTTTTPLSGTNAICSANIKGYTDLDSTIDITAPSTSAITSLTVNNTQYIDGVNTSSITLNNVKPINNGLFLVTYGAAGEPVYFVGWADSISGLTPPLGL